ncbi:3-oxoacyl-[acyl-carrier-protein] synthase-3 [Saccharothrix tamanrassetensis]|uniref:3-oxoacyl-[acyl-carrier-protein] synthase-3 n=1 Tax=Saccharothrix tamanrassetensis TaxID=1051531 RepID=A0A841CJS6_9PSEU|nr:3-oxoacyl-ACP synthase III family protein [Saccharothrix tamanrassetensis]MBB5957320.1 3-oxoacyl-[acyl-carrier-protein] synthase-3 [Saccharothrix tamanrassetensis]
MTWARMVGVAAHLPERRTSSADIEARLAELNPGLDVPRDFIERMSGVRYRHTAPEGWTAAELAAAAAGKLLADCGRDIADVDLLIFAATSMSVIEPATAHIVANLLGASCPVFDVKNACNSVFNAIEVADAMISAGRYRRVLIACGEWLSPVIRWQAKDGDLRDYFEVALSHTVSDAGAAVLLEAADAPGVLRTAAHADSSAWDAAAATIAVTPGASRLGAFRVDAMRLQRVFLDIDTGLVDRAFEPLGLVLSDFAVVCVHQPYTGLLPQFAERLGLTDDQMVPVVAEHGNVAAAGLLLQLTKAVESGRVRRGDLVALVGLASGTSIGIAVVRW